MVIEVNRGAIHVRFGDNAGPILLMTDGLAFRQDLHTASFRSEQKAKNHDYSPSIDFQLSPMATVTHRTTKT